MQKYKRFLTLFALFLISPVYTASAYSPAMGGAETKIIFVNASKHGEAYAGAYKSDYVKPGMVAELPSLWDVSHIGCETYPYPFLVRGSNNVQELCNFNVTLTTCYEPRIGAVVHGKVTNLKNNKPSFSNTTITDICEVKWKGIGKNHGSGFYNSSKIEIVVKSTVGKY